MARRASSSASEKGSGPFREASARSHGARAKGGGGRRGYGCVGVHAVGPQASATPLRPSAPDRSAWLVRTELAQDMPVTRKSFFLGGSIRLLDVAPQSVVAWYWRIPARVLHGATLGVTRAGQTSGNGRLAEVRRRDRRGYRRVAFLPCQSAGDNPAVSADAVRSPNQPQEQG